MKTVTDEADSSGTAAYEQLESDVSPKRHDRSTECRRIARLYAAEGDVGAERACLFEALALDLEPYHGESRHEALFGGSRFAPRIYFKKPNGEIVCRPSSEDFTPDVLGHLRNRAAETSNPVHRARFWDVLWETTRDHRAARNAYEAYAELIPIVLADDWRPEFYDTLDRLKTLALRLGDAALIDRMVETHRSVFENLRTSNRFRWFLEPLRSLLDSPSKLPGAGYQQLAILAEESATHFRDEGNVLLERQFLAVAADTHRKAKDSVNALTAQRSLAESFEREGRGALASAGGGLIAVVALQHALQVYIDLGTCPDKVTEMKGLLKEAALQGEREAKRIKVPLEVPNQMVTRLLDRIRELSVAQGIAELVEATSLLPNFSRASEVASEAAQRYPMQFLFPIQIMRGANPVLVITDDAGKANYYAIQSIVRDAMVLSIDLFHRAIELLKEKGADAGAFRDLLASTNLFSDDRRELIGRGIERYLAGDWISALHILPIQLEGVIRDIGGMLNVPTTSKKPDGLHDRLLSDLLTEPALTDALGTDFVVLLSAVLTDQRGLNLRNDVAHALLRVPAFQPMLCALLVAFILRLTAFRFTPKPRTDDISKPPAGDA